MPFQRPHNLRPKINTETGEVEEVTLVETDEQRRRRLANEARQQVVAEKRKAKQAQELAEGKKKKKEERTYMPEAYPWDSIENYFVQGAPDKNGIIYYPTITDICSYFHVNFLTVRKRLLDENWIEKRDQWQTALQKQVQKVTMIDYVEAAAKFDATCVEAAQSAMQEILDKFHEAKAQAEPITHLDLDRLGRAAVSWQRVGRLALGLSTENTAAKFETKSGDTISSIDLSQLSNEEMEQMKMLLQKATAREQEVIEAQVIEMQSDSVREDKMSDQELGNRREDITKE